MSCCIFCTKELGDGQPTTQLREKGCVTINTLASSLGLSVIVTTGQRVHKDCRRDFCRPREARQLGNRGAGFSEEYRRLRSNGGFDFGQHCLFCGKAAKLKGCKRGHDVYPVRTFDFQATIREVCEGRKDEWGYQVLARLEFAQDLHAADAIYHQTCNVNFRTARQLPSSKQTVPEATVKSPRGRPENLEQNAAFVSVMQFFEENDNEQTSVHDLVLKMEELIPGCAYSAVYMKKRLKEHYKDRVVITELNGVSNIVTFKETASSILNDFYNQPKNMDTAEQKASIIKAAAKLIQSEIKEMPVNKDTYPSPVALSSLEEQTDFLPGSLSAFLSTLFPKNTNGVKKA